MLSHGDELGRTQRGNNNAYCQDNELAWIDWTLDDAERELLAFVKKVFRIRATNPVFRRRKYFAGDPVTDTGVKDVHWLRADGRDATMEDWHESRNRVLGMLIHGQASDELDERGRPNRGQTLLCLMNASNRARSFALPALHEPGQWYEIVNTAQPVEHVERGASIHVPPHALVLLSHHEAEPS